MQYNFIDNENEKYRKIIESELLTNENPFPRNPVSSRDNLPKFCLGRDEEIGVIKNGIEKVATEYSHKSAWIPINGSGGTGKTTIALYVYDSAKTKKSRDLEIDYLECAYLESPSEPSLLNINTLYQKIISDLGNSPGNFPYQIGFKFMNKFIEFIESQENIKDVFNQKFGDAIKYFKRSKSHTDLMLNLKNKVPQFARNFKFFIQEYDFVFLNNPDINLPIDYIYCMIDLLSDHSGFRSKAHEEILGRNIKNDDDAIKKLENLISVLNFLSKKNCLLIILDNLEYLPKVQGSCDNLFRILLQFRNNINNCVLLTIGSTDFWEFFNRNLNASELNMLTGFKFEDISLSNLSERDASRIMNRYITEFWSSINTKYIPKDSDGSFPFSRAAFQYLYETNERNLRDSLKQLNKMLEKYKIDNEIHYLKDIKDAIYYMRPPLEKVYLYENELSFLENFNLNFNNRNQLSRDFEYGLVRAFNTIIDNTQYGNLIQKVKHEPNIKLKNGSYAKPDVFLTLFGRNSLQDVKYAEIQVKAYYSTNKVKFEDIQGSFELLNENKSHFLTFITLSPLDQNLIREINKFGNRIGRTSKLSNEESCYLLLLTKSFSELFFKQEQLEPPFYLQILEKIGIKLPDFIERIRKIDVMKKSPEEKKIKEEPEPSTTERPKTPDEKISNPTLLEQHIIKFLEEKKLVKNQTILINGVIHLASSQNVVKNAISNLKEKKVLAFSRKSPQGWSLI